MIIGREEKVIKKNKIKLIETPYNSGRNKNNKIKSYIYSSPQSNQLKRLFHSPKYNISQKFKNNFMYSSSINNKEKEKNMEEKYKYLLEKNKNANKKKYNYYPKKINNYNNDNNNNIQEIKPYNLKNNEYLKKNNYNKLYRYENTLIFIDNNIKNIYK